MERSFGCACAFKFTKRHRRFEAAGRGHAQLEESLSHIVPGTAAEPAVLNQVARKRLGLSAQRCGGAPARLSIRLHVSNP
jgi:hypothetical protein